MTKEERKEKFEREHPDLMAKRIFELKMVEIHEQCDIKKLARKEKILEMYYQQNMTLSEIGQLQQPPVTRQRIYQIVRNL